MELSLSPGHNNVIRSVPARLTRGPNTPSQIQSSYTRIGLKRKGQWLTAVKSVSRAEKTFGARCNEDELYKEPKYGICQHVCCYSSHISLIVGIVLHGQAVLSVGPNPNPLVRPQTSPVPSQQIRSICDKHRIAVSPDLAPGSQYPDIPHHKEASY